MYLCKKCHVLPCPNDSPIVSYSSCQKCGAEDDCVECKAADPQITIFSPKPSEEIQFLRSRIDELESLLAAKAVAGLPARSSEVALTSEVEDLRSMLLAIARYATLVLSERSGP